MMAGCGERRRRRPPDGKRPPAAMLLAAAAAAVAAAVAAVAAAASSDPPCDQRIIGDALVLHNQIRARHGAPPLVLNAKVVGGSVANWHFSMPDFISLAFLKMICH